MDDANRVPIDIGYEVAIAAATDQRTVVKEDGTVVIDILVTQPCAPEPSIGEEIVVCAGALRCSANPCLGRHHLPQWNSYKRR